MEEKNYEKYNHPGYVEQLKPETKYTSRKVQVDGITLYDSETAFRKNFLKNHLKNTVDVVRFSYMMGKLAVKPVIGPMIRKSLEWHYRYIHTNSVVVPSCKGYNPQHYGYCRVALRVPHGAGALRQPHKHLLRS